VRCIPTYDPCEPYSNADHPAQVICCASNIVLQSVCRDEIQSQACAARVQKIMEYASSDIRFDVPLADACFEDRQEFCANVSPGSARVIRCLQDRCRTLPYPTPGLSRTSTHCAWSGFCVAWKCTHLKQPGSIHLLGMYIVFGFCRAYNSALCCV